MGLEERRTQSERSQTWSAVFSGDFPVSISGLHGDSCSSLWPLWPPHSFPDFWAVVVSLWVSRKPVSGYSLLHVIIYTHHLVLKNSKVISLTRRGQSSGAKWARVRKGGARSKGTGRAEAGHCVLCAGCMELLTQIISRHWQTRNLTAAMRTITYAWKTCKTRKQNFSQFGAKKTQAST